MEAPLLSVGILPFPTCHDHQINMNFKKEKKKKSPFYSCKRKQFLPPMKRYPISVSY